jgi:hypothetical protein
VPPPSDGPYAAAWSRYRRWSRAYWIVFASFLPAVALLSRASGWLQRGQPGPVFAVAIVWMIAWALIGRVTSTFHCPRCGELFFHVFDARPWRQSWRHNPFARRCLHCGLPKWATRDVATGDV